MQLIIFKTHRNFSGQIPHIVVYAGVTLVAVASLFSINLLIKNSINGILKRGLQLVIVGSIMQIVSGFGDSISHDMFGN